jgi:cation diffusion facilitator family transporter
MSAGGSTGEVIKSLVVNVVIALSKGVAAVITGSGAMLAETLHSFADCGNQILLLVGIKQAGRPPDDKHPLGYGRNLYFYSFIVALLLFTGGGMFSIYEGVHKMEEPEEVGDIGVALIILAISFLLEGWSTLGNIKAMNKKRGKMPFFTYMKETKDSDLIVIFGENSAAVLGLTFAAAALVIAKVTKDGRWDAAGSIAIGVVLVGVAVFLAREIKGLLVGEAADPSLIQIVEELVVAHPDIEKLVEIIPVQQGPGEILIAMKLKFKSGLQTDRLVDIINEFETELRARVPEAKWCFIEPDREEGARKFAAAHK